MTSGLAGKKIWLIGASEGIGRVLAQKLAGEGAVLALSARQQDKLAALANDTGGLCVPLDVRDEMQMKSAYAQITHAWGRPDIVIYNAGTYEPMTAQDFNLAQTETMVDVNFRGALRMLDCVLPAFIKANQGHLVLVASIAAYRGLPGAIGYGASKAALLHLAENLYIDLAGSGVTIQAVCPGFVRTRLTEKNTFHMPDLIEPDQAAARIVRGLGSKAFEIRFPFLFPLALRLISYLPMNVFAYLIRR